MDNVMIDEKRIHVDFGQSVGEKCGNIEPLPEDALRARRTSEMKKDEEKRKGPDHDPKKRGRQVKK